MAFPIVLRGEIPSLRHQPRLKFGKRILATKVALKMLVDYVN
ncbi:MAG TPA: hypothetical protein VLK37_07465 [Solirubrobacterales bacterium]|nr:hypothetical protein [Solirubrobacterales bacterium]